MKNQDIFNANIGRYRELYRLVNGKNYNGEITYEKGFVVFKKRGNKARLKEFLEMKDNLEKRYRRNNEQ